FVPNFGFVPIAPTLPPVADQMFTTDAHFEDGLNRVWALAGRKSFDEAEAQLMAIINASDSRGNNNYRAAESLCASARLHAFDDDRTVYSWLRDRGITLWYAWGSGATSGGEGFTRGLEIHKAERDFADLERKLGLKS
ncbi:MAG: hypothetical protein ABI852_03760, partial [Gemmatimonadaceae bacterium]